MQIGIFAKTFPRHRCRRRARRRCATPAMTVTQFNMACAGLPSMPDAVAGAMLPTRSPRRSERVRRGASSALSGTYNMIHPDTSGARGRPAPAGGVHRGRGGTFAVRLVTLCTGTRNRDDQWAHHPDNAEPAAWADMAREMEKALQLAERHGVDLGIEPEQANIVTSAADAMRLIGEMGSTRLRIVLDPANLFEQADRAEARAIVARRDRNARRAMSPWPTPRTASPTAASPPPARRRRFR